MENVPAVPGPQVYSEGGDDNGIWLDQNMIWAFILSWSARRRVGFQRREPAQVI